MRLKMIPEIKKILYATDLSENARYAFTYAVSLADRYGAKITILHVLEELHPGATNLAAQIVGEEKWNELRKDNEQNVIHMIKTRLETFCEDVANEVPQCQFFVDQVLVKIGHPADIILKQAEATQCDMVVMGTHGLGLLADVAMGSTSRRVARRCNKPVLIVRLPEGHGNI